MKQLEPNNASSSSLNQSGWPRILALFAILCSIKLALICQLAPHLYQTHWRVAGAELTVAGRIAFYVFLALAGAHFFLLARDCRLAGIGAVRIANAGIAGIGLLFIFLTFHNGTNNYLFPIFSGVLKWSSLGPYLSLDFCFQQPYLAAWVFIYGLTYYGLARTRRESWTIYLTVSAAVFYALWHLRGLAIYRDELLVIDCIGMVSLAVPFLSRKPLSGTFVLAPVIWPLSFSVLLLWQFGEPFGLANLYFYGLVLTTMLLFGLFSVILTKQGMRLRLWFAQSLFFAAAFLLLANANYPLAQNYNQALWLGFEFPRYFIGQAMVAAGLFIVAELQRRVFPRMTLLWLDVAAVVLVALALIDFRLTRLLGVRLDWSVLVLGDSPKMMWRMARPYLPVVVLAIACLAGLYAALIGLIRRSRVFRTGECNLAGWSYLTALFVLLAVLGCWNALPDKARGEASFRLASTSPWWKKLTGHSMRPQQFFEAAKSLGVTFDAAASVSASGAPRDLNVVLVFMESTYNRHLSLFGAQTETQPLLSEFKDRMELFPNFFSCFASSIHARFAAFTSLYPVQDYNLFTAQHVPVKSIFEVLHDRGYDCSMFYSSYGDFTGFRDFLRGRGVELYDADNMPGQRKSQRVSWGLREEETLGAMRDQIQHYGAERKKFFLTYVPAAPHYPYDAIPERFRKFTATEPGDYTPMYLNELLYMDWVLASLVAQLRDSGVLEKTLVIITDDHGEMTGGKDGPIGHGWWLTPELANAPLIIMDPEKRQYQVNTTIGSQVDLLPTICDRLRIPLPEGQLYQGRSLDGANPGIGRLSWLNSFQQYSVIEGNRLIFGDREKELQGKAAMGLAYKITNNGSETVFQCDSTAVRLPASIRGFDQFQQELLRNYSHYVPAIAPLAHPSGVTMKD